MQLIYSRICSISSSIIINRSSSSSLSRRRRSSGSSPSSSSLFVSSLSAILHKQTFAENFYLKMSQPTINYFAHSFIDRSSDKRKDQQWLSEQLKSDQSVFILFHCDKPFVRIDKENKMFSLTKLNYSKISFLLDTTNKTSKATTPLWLFLGVQYEKNPDYVESESEHESTKHEWQILHSPYSNENKYIQDKFKSWFAIDTSSYDQESTKIVELFKEHGEFFEGNFLRLMAIQDIVEASIIAQARSVFCWHDRNKFCATCGSPNVVEEGGFKLACKNSACKSNDRTFNKHVPSNIQYPRVDPVVIMLIVNPAKTHFLLGRKKQFPEKMFSCLAGYVEAGESIEEAVRREVFEESGLYTDRVVYHSSQPWPFPSTLMIGCLAYATSTHITVDQNEIQEARWFALDEIEQIANNTHPDKVTIPGARTIANQLIRYFSRNKSKL